MAQDGKQEAIIEAAIKRFAHFGVAKTTMAEIAADLSLSKASLYYYFPDKLNLYAAVFQKITTDGAAEDDKLLEAEKDPFKAIDWFLQKRTAFIVQYQNIIEFIKTFGPARIPPELEPVFNQLKKRELKRLTGIIQKGIDGGIFPLEEASRVASLFFDFLEGFRTARLLDNKQFFPDKKQLQAILRQEQAFARIFFNGLTIPPGR